MTDMAMERLEEMDRRARRALSDLVEDAEITDDARFIAACNRRDLAELGFILLLGLERLKHET